MRIIDLSLIKSEEDFEKMSFALLKKAKPGLKSVRGQGGDQGIDLYVGTLPDKVDEVIQCKLFKSGNLTSNRKTQIEKSFEKAINHNPKVWTLVISLNLTKKQQEWLLDLNKKFKTKFKIDIIQKDNLISDLIENENIAKYFIPNYITHSSEQVIKSEIVEEMEILPVNKVNFPKQIGCSQIRLYGKKISELLDHFSGMRFDKITSGFTDLNTITKNKEYSIYFITNPKSNSLRIEHNEDPFKVFFPSGRRIKIWIKNIKETGDTVDALEITVFTSNHKILKEIQTKIKSCISHGDIIKIMTFNTRMKTLVNKFASSINAIKFDPNFTEKIKDKLKNTKIKIKNATFYSDEGGIVEMPEIRDILNGVKKIGKNKISDIFYFHSKKSTKIDNVNYIGFDLHHSGRIRCFFNKLNFNDEDEMRQTIYNFIKEEARESNL